jgi:chemotaxis protein MotB
MRTVSRRRKQPERANHERWLVSYADFITLLFAFFTTLYAISTVDQKKVGKLVYSMRTAFNVDFFPTKHGVAGYPAVSPRPIVNIDPFSTGRGNGAIPAGYAALAQELEKLAKIPELDGRVGVRVEKRGIVISLSEAAFFESGKADVRSSAMPALGTVAEKLRGHELDVVIEGHTDNLPVRGGRYGSNWELSTARATSVVAILLDNYGYDAKHLTAAGYAEYKPVADNTTVAGRARNRRVDIVVSPPVQEAAAPAARDGSPPAHAAITAVR